MAGIRRGQGSVNHARSSFINHTDREPLNVFLRLRPAKMHVFLGAFALGCVAVSAHAQSTAEDPAKFPLRRTLAVSPATPAIAEAPRAATQSPPGTVPFLLPPGTGAGTTGFISASPKVKRARNAKKSAAKQVAASAPPARVAPSRSAASSEVTAAITPARQPRRRPPEAEPFAPVGINVGSFTLRSILDLSVGYDSNALRTPGGPGSKFYLVAPQFTARSNWTRHELTADLRGSYTEYADVRGIDRPELYGTVRGRIDVAALTRIEIEGRASLTTILQGSPDAVGGVVRPPNVYSFGTTMGIVQRFNRFEIGLRGLFDRYIYDNATLNSGGILDLSDRNYDAYGARLRGAYEWTPGIKSFLETGIDTRKFVLDMDFTGIRRGSDGWLARAGVAFERPGFLTGEISAGYMQRHYRDPSLPDISGLLFDSALVWTATPLTKVTLGATSTIEESYLPGASGMFRHEARVVVEHAFRQWLIATANVSYGIEDYRGAGRDDHRLRLGAGLIYYLNRAVALRGEYRYEQLISDVPGQSVAANVGLIGLRLQR